jgi:hypothetical protein
VNQRGSRWFSFFYSARWSQLSDSILHNPFWSCCIYYRCPAWILIHALNSAPNQVPVLHAVPRLCSASNFSFPPGQSSAFMASLPCVILAGGNCSWATEAKNSSFLSSNCSHMVIFWTRPQGARWNVCEDLNWFWCGFCCHSLTCVLVGIDSCFRCDLKVPNLVLRASSLSIAMWSWLS